MCAALEMPEAGPSSLAGSSSAPNVGSAASRLKNSPFAASVGSLNGSRKKKGWAPPPGAFNEPDLPRFSNPGPGRYNPMAQAACLSTKPRVVACRFGSEDRLKNIGKLSYGNDSPGPSYFPSYNLVRSQSQSTSFTVARRDCGDVERISRHGGPGPGMYTPMDRQLSTTRNHLAGGTFLADDRTKYLGEVDPDSLMPAKKFSPGPMYAPSADAGKRRSGTVVFGGKGPGTIMKPPSLAAETPGPGAYTPASQGQCLSTKPRAPAAGFGIESKGNKQMMDTSHCFVKSVAVDMSHATAQNLSPGPAYNPSWIAVQSKPQGGVIGTSKRFYFGPNRNG